MMRVLTLFVWVNLLLHSPIYAQHSPLPFNQNKVNKPSLFSALPDVFECDGASLQKILSAGINEQITMQLSSQFLIKGLIVDKNHQNPAHFSVNTRLSNYDNALFNISVRLLADNSTIIQGRIIHPKYADVLVLYREKDKYYFKKQLQRLYMPE